MKQRRNLSKHNNFTISRGTQVPRNESELKKFYKSFFTEENYRTRTKKALEMAGPLGNEWNRNYVTALRSLGLTVGKQGSLFHEYYQKTKYIHPPEPLPIEGTDRKEWDNADFICWIGLEPWRHRIACAAIRGRDGFPMASVRHYDKHFVHNAKKLKDPSNFLRQFDKDQGFLDNYNIYWTREEAMIIARSTGQLDNVDERVKHLLDGVELFSELLY